MKTLHVNLAVKSLEDSVKFYNSLFGSEPIVSKEDYAKWLLNDPRVNFSVSKTKGNFGIQHLGIQAENESELAEIIENMDHATKNAYEEGHTVCCYAKSDKTWAVDPEGVEWEGFYTYGESEVNKDEDRACCDQTCCVS